LKQAADPSFKTYAKQVRANAHAIAQVLFKHGYKLQTDGTENHLILWDLRPLGLTGSKVEKICDAAHITLNKNAVAGDSMSPSFITINKANSQPPLWSQVVYESVPPPLLPDQ
jgi:glycine/serine hydroxymethyltransferase